MPDGKARGATGRRPIRETVGPEVTRTGLVLVIGVLAPIFDSTIVAIALHTLADRLHAPLPTVQWVSTAYLLALAVAIPLVGWAQARIGGKRLWLTALVVFLTGSVLCAVAWNAPSLIAFRVIQGLGGGIMFPLMQSLMMQAADGRALGRALAIISLPASLGPILGPVLGGVILHWLDWRWLFLVNVPVCVLAWLLAWRLLPDDRPAPDRRRRLDAVGLLLVAGGVFGVLLGLSDVEEGGSFARTDVLVSLAAGLSLLAAFTAHAVRREEPAILDVRVLARRPVALSSGLLFLSGTALYGAMFVLPLYFQNLRGESVLYASLLLIPQGLGSLMTRTLTGRLVGTVGARRVAVAGFAVIGVGTLPFALAGADTNLWWLAAVLLVRGLGLGMVMIPAMSAAYAGLDRGRIPQASMITRVAQQLGGSFGTAVLAVILETGLASPGHDPARAFTDAFWWSTALSLSAVALSLLLPGRPRETAATVQATSVLPASAPSRGSVRLGAAPDEPEADSRHR